MSHEWNCTCQRCRDDRRRWDEPADDDAEREAEDREHARILDDRKPR